MGGWIHDCTEVCSKCGKKYDIYKMNIGMRDKDSINCDCGNRLIEWNGGVMYDARPVKKE